MKFEIGQQFKTRGGWRAVVVDVYDDGCIRVWHNSLQQGGEVYSHSKSGRFCIPGTDISYYDLIETWKEPRKGTVWVNVWRDRDNDEISYGAANRRTEADNEKYSSYERIACVEVNWTEGQGI